MAIPPKPIKLPLSAKMMIFYPKMDKGMSLSKMPQLGSFMPVRSYSKDGSEHLEKQKDHLGQDMSHPEQIKKDCLELYLKASLFVGITTGMFTFLYGVGVPGIDPFTSMFLVPASFAIGFLAFFLWVPGSIIFIIHKWLS